MKKFAILFITLIAFCSGTAEASEKLKVFACESHWASFVKEFAKDKVDIFVATSPKQDPRFINNRKQALAAIKEAKLLFCSGGGLENGWLDILIQKSGNNEITPGAKGNLMAIEHVDAIEKPDMESGQGNYIYNQGNPFVHLNPYNISRIGVVLLGKLVEIDPANASFYKDNYYPFMRKWSESMQRWDSEIQQFRGINFASSNGAFGYLANWGGMNNVGVFESKPGVQPSGFQAKRIAQFIKSKGANYIFKAGFDSEKIVNSIKKESSLKVVEVPYTVGENKKIKNLFDLFDSIISTITEDK